MSTDESGVRPAKSRHAFGCLALLLGGFAGLTLIEVGLRLVTTDPSGGTDASLAERLEASRAAAPDSGSGRFSLYGLVEASPHDDVVYELKPNVLGTFRDQLITTNRHGHRQSTEPSIDKPEGVYRIVGLGDSHMFGWGVAQGETYLELLEEQLNAALGTSKLEVVNCAAPGYNTAMEVALFENECRQFSADLVLLHFIGNDFDFPHFMRSVRSHEGAAEGRDGPSARSPLRSWQLLERWWNSRTPDPAAEGGMEIGAEPLPDLLPHSRRFASREERRAARAQYADSIGAEGVSRALLRLAELTSGEASSDPVPVVVLMLGTGDESRQSVVALAEELGFDVLDAAPHFAEALERRGLQPTREIWRQEYLIPRDGHPTARAHREYAALLAEFVRKRIS